MLISCTYTVITDPARLAEHLRRTCESEQKKKSNQVETVAPVHCTLRFCIQPPGSGRVTWEQSFQRLCARVRLSGGSDTATALFPPVA